MIELLIIALVVFGYALVLVLFTDAIRIDLHALRHHAALSGRMLGIGLPLTVVAGTALAVVVVPGLSVIEAAWPVCDARQWTGPSHQPS